MVEQQTTIVNFHLYERLLFFMNKQSSMQKVCFFVGITEQEEAQYRRKLFFQKSLAILANLVILGLPLYGFKKKFKLS